MNSISMKQTMKQSGIKRLATVLCVGLIALSTAGMGTATLASGGNGGGGGGGSSKSGGTTDGTVVVVTLVPQIASYNGAVPKGAVNLGFAADGSAQSMAFNLSSIKVADGTALPVHVIMGKIQTIFTYYALSSVVYTEADGTITINHSSATLTLSKLKGDVVPDFPNPNGLGTTEIRILTPDGTTTLLDGIVGTFHP